MRNFRYLLLVGVGSLMGCAQAGMALSTDATQAIAIAQAMGDTSTIPCYQAFAAAGSAQANIKQAGILTVLESKRSLKMALQNPACSPVKDELVTDALKLTPLAPIATFLSPSS